MECGTPAPGCQSMARLWNVGHPPPAVRIWRGYGMWDTRPRLSEYGEIIECGTAALGCQTVARLWNVGQPPPAVRVWRDYGMWDSRPRLSEYGELQGPTGEGACPTLALCCGVVSRPRHSSDRRSPPSWWHGRQTPPQLRSKSHACAAAQERPATLPHFNHAYGSLPAFI